MDMSIRTLLLIIVAVPLIVIGAAMALDVKLPVPVLGRDYVVRVELDGSAKPVAPPDIAGPNDPARPLVVIDAGHGGRDPGAVGIDTNGKRVREKDITLAIALALREELVRRGGIRVALTRADDRLLALADRPELARQLDADLFLSIHADSAGGYTNVSGASIYTLSSEASSEAAARFAERENNADRVNGLTIEGESAEVSAILVELSQAQTQADASEFAGLINREGQGEIKFHPQARRSAALAVLRAPDVPSVLFESGFVTNQNDRERLITAEGQATCANVLASAIQIYFARRSEN